MSYDYDPPSVCWDTYPRARKSHRCCECNGEIKPGETYRRVAGVWCGDFSVFKVCDPCERLRAYLMVDGREQICFGEVYEALDAVEDELNSMEVLAVLAGT